LNLDREELAAWLRLIETPALGREAIRQLLSAFGSPQRVLAASQSALREIGASKAVAEALGRPGIDIQTRLDATLAWLADAGANPRHVIAIGDPLYPQLLLETPDPPLLIHAIGDVALLQTAAVAIVGSRNPTPQGLENARAFAAHLSHAGVPVVSGLALGIDGAAHEGALEGPAGTIAVVGTGIDSVYPRRHLDLAQRIASHGLIISEYPLGTPPLAAHFPQRNRIIAGLTRGTLVVEAAIQSGSLITARMALEAGRDVFAIPGSIHSPQSRGCHLLIKQGAKLVDRAEDVLEELHLLPQPAAVATAPDASVDAPAKRLAFDATRSAGGAETERTGGVDDPIDESCPKEPLLDVLGFDPMTLDELVARTGWPSHELSGRLLDLELQGRVARMPGQRFQRLVLA
jgi:DNA processing protein